MNPPHSIGEFARLTRLTVVALRYYDRVGLLTPAHVDRATGYRYYDDTQVDDAIRLGLLRSLGVPVPLLAEWRAGQRGLRDLVAEHRDRLAVEISERRAALAALDAVDTDRPPLRPRVEDGDRAADDVVALTTETTWHGVGGATRFALARLAVLLRRAGDDAPQRPGASFPLDPGERVAVRVFARSNVPIERLPVPLMAVTLVGGPVLRAEHHGDRRLLPFVYRTLLAEAARRALAVEGDVREHYGTDEDGTPRTIVSIGVRSV